MIFQGVESGPPLDPRMYPGIDRELTSFFVLYADHKPQGFMGIVKAGRKLLGTKLDTGRNVPSSEG